MPFNPKDVARAVRQHRVAAGLTQAELAEHAGLAFETISRIESGREPPSLRTAIGLADALAVSLDAVVGHVPGQPPPQRPALRTRCTKASCGRAAPGSQDAQAPERPGARTAARTQANVATRAVIAVSACRSRPRIPTLIEQAREIIACQADRATCRTRARRRVPGRP